MSESKISVAIDVPEGLPKIGVLLTCDPKTNAQFDAVVAAVGGPCAFDYHSESSAHAKLPDGSTLILHAPDAMRTYSRPLAPSISALKAACKR